MCGINTHMSFCVCDIWEGPLCMKVYVIFRVLLKIVVLLLSRSVSCGVTCCMHTGRLGRQADVAFRHTVYRLCRTTSTRPGCSCSSVSSV